MTYSCHSCRDTFPAPIPTLLCPSCGSFQVSLTSPVESHVTWVTETYSGPPESLAAKILDLIQSGATGSLSLNLKEGRIGTFEFRRRAPRPPHLPPSSFSSSDSLDPSSLPSLDTLPVS